MSLSSTGRGEFENYFRIVRVTIATTFPRQQIASNGNIFCYLLPRYTHAVIFGNPFQGAPCQVPWFFLAMGLIQWRKSPFVVWEHNFELYEQILMILHHKLFAYLEMLVSCGKGENQNLFLVKTNISLIRMLLQNKHEDFEAWNQKSHWN